MAYTLYSLLLQFIKSNLNLARIALGFIPLCKKLWFIGVRDVCHTGCLELKVLNMTNHSAGSPNSLALLGRVLKATPKKHKDILSQNLCICYKVRISSLHQNLANAFFVFAICFKIEAVT